MSERVIIATADQNAAVIKNTKGRLASYSLSNTAASFRFVKLYDKATAPTAADTPKYVVAIPPNSSITFTPPMAVLFSIGISIRIVTGSANNDNTAVSAGDVVGTIQYS